MDRLTQIERIAALIRDVESLKDEQAKRILIDRALLTLDENKVEPVVVLPAKVHQVHEVKERRNPRPKNSGTRGRVLEVINQLATHEKPLSSTEICDLLEPKDREIVGNSLSALFAAGKVNRLRSFDRDAADRKITLYKYYPKEGGE